MTLPSCHLLALSLTLLPTTAGAAAGCAQPGQKPPAATIETRVEDLKRTFPGAQVQLDPTRSRVRRISGLTVGPTEATAPVEQAFEILKRAPVASALGLSTELRELCEPAVGADPQLPRSYVIRLQQCIEGVKVVGAELVINLREASSPIVDVISSITNRFSGSIAPAITAQAAEAAARSARQRTADERASASTSSATRQNPRPQLVVFDPMLYRMPGEARLCWLTRLGSDVLLVDAANGAVLQQYSDLLRVVFK
jgi:hypothetical protein